MGRVTEINLRYTRITTADLIDVIVPNSEFINGRVINWTLGEPVRRIHVPFGVAYGADKKLVKEAAVAAALSIEGTERGSNREPDAWLVGFGDSSLNFELVVWVGPKSIIVPAKTQAQYLWAIEDELRKRHIEIPFPQRDLHIRSGTLAVSLNKNE
jgi:small-conductance mechanosensitive channel